MYIKFKLPALFLILLNYNIELHRIASNITEYHRISRIFTNFSILSNWLESSHDLEISKKFSKISHEYPEFLKNHRISPEFPSSEPPDECSNSGLNRIRKSVSYMRQRNAILLTYVYLCVWNRRREREFQKKTIKERDQLQRRFRCNN